MCTRRTTEATTGDALVDTMAALARAGAERVRLDGLDATSVGALLEASVGAHDPQLDAIVADVTGGNPFFVLQYARLLAGLPDLERVDPGALPVPDGIRDVLRQRIQRLPDEGVRALTAAAVLGHRIDPDLVAELAGTSVDQCLDLLDLAMTSGLVEEQDTGYAFVHALARETMYGEVSAARRMRLHDRAGRIIEAHQANDADASAEIAHHAHLAAPLSAEHAERSCALVGASRTGGHSRHAHAEALELWQHGRSRTLPTDSITALEAMCGAAAALLRMARTVEGTAARSSGPCTSASGSVAGTSWRARPPSSTGRACGPGVSTASVTTRSSRCSPRQPRHVADPERARLLAALQMEHYYGWDSSVADRIGARVGRGRADLRRPGPAGRGAAGPDHRHLGTRPRATRGSS